MRFARSPLQFARGNSPRPHAGGADHAVPSSLAQPLRIPVALRRLLLRAWSAPWSSRIVGPTRNRSWLTASQGTAEDAVAGSVRDGLGQVVNELRGGFVLRPGAITLAMATLSLAITNVEERITAVQSWNDILDRVFPPEPQAAYVVLGTIAGSMITVVSVVYSVLLVVLTFASTQFSPRVLVSFVEDRVSQTTLGMFVGTFTYCLLTLPAIRSQPRPFVPSVAVIVAMVFAVACLACLLYFIHHIASSIQASQIVDRIARDTERVLDQLFPDPLDGPLPPTYRESMTAGTAVLAVRSGYIRSINERSLLATARSADVVLQVERYIGQFVMAGTPVLKTSPAERVNVALEATCLRAFNIGPARTMDQDIEFGVLQIVDIAAPGHLAGSQRSDDGPDVHRPPRQHSGARRHPQATGVRAPRCRRPAAGDASAHVVSSPPRRRL